MITVTPTEFGYRITIVDVEYPIRNYEILTDYIDEIPDEETRDGLTALLTELEIGGEQ